MHLKVLELFAGIGAWSKALDRLAIPYELAGFAEINKYATQSYCAIHGVSPDLNLGDITELDGTRLPKVDLICASPPCQAFSIAGKQLGMNDERGMLFLDTLRIIEQTMPKYLLLENVKGLTFKKFEPELAYILSYLDGLGYNIYHKVLDARDYGIPQSRKRLFFVGIRKEIDNMTFEFPAPYPLEIKLRDLLEPVVDEKYFISGKHLVYWKKNSERDCKKGFTSIDRDVAICQTARQYANWKGNYVTDKLNCIGLINGQDSQGTRVYDDNISSCISSQGGGLGAKTGLYVQDGRVRKLTPPECMRLMDFDDVDFYKLRDIGMSDAQLYRMCGNSIVVNVVCEIMKNLF